MTADPVSAPLDPDSLHTAATARTGLHDFGPSTGYRDALQRLTHALETEAQLTGQGRTEAHRTLVSALTTRLRLRAAPPSPPLPPEPVFIIGLPRTGSTLLHALLDCHPALHAVRLWELMHPLSPPGIPDQELVAATRRHVTAHFAAAPALLRIHPTDAQSPEECEYLMTTDFRNAVLGLISYRVPGYTDWLLDQDLTGAYRVHREQLRHILARRPAAPGARLLLKSPSHLWHLPSLAAVHPHARFVVLHRDLAQATASAASLALHARRKRSDHADPHEIGRQLARAAGLGADRLAEFTARPPGSTASVHIDFDDLTADPEQAVCRVFRFLGLPVTEAVRERCRRHLEQHPREAHHYTGRDFGLAADGPTDPGPR
ncbi:sulfotransferase family protein [Kitasatospora purpeofusca]|uniref:sulfotransferase family protein n=1 Tax=Kitasatospora purpeofusca TaxID=67352 RepID=UPI00386E88C2